MNETNKKIIKYKLVLGIRKYNKNLILKSIISSNRKLLKLIEMRFRNKILNYKFHPFTEIYIL